MPSSASPVAIAEDQKFPIGYVGYDRKVGVEAFPDSAEIDAVPGWGVVEFLMEKGDVEVSFEGFREIEEEEGVGFCDPMELEAAVGVGGFLLRDVGDEVGSEGAPDQVILVERVEDS